MQLTPKSQSRKPMVISEAVREAIDFNFSLPTPQDIHCRYAPPRTLGASAAHQMAMDAHLEECGVYSLLQHAVSLGMGFEEIAPQFLGYAYLSGLTQNTWIRAGVETTADEMTRRWIELERAGEDKTDEDADGTDDRLQQLEIAMDDFGLQELFNRAQCLCDYFGGCLVYIDTGDLDDEAKKKPLVLGRGTFISGSLRRFTIVEPVNVYPGRYNASDPLSPHYFKPESWMVLGKEIHASRFLYFTANEMPLLLRAAYNFFGIPTAQLALDPVGHFNKTREAVSRLVTKFSLTALKTNMSGVFQGGGTSDLDSRMTYFVQKQSNDGLMVIDMNDEDLLKLETPISGVTDIPRQCLEFVSASFRLPVTKYLGISPSGFNATGEADLQNFYDYLSSRQEKILRKPLARALDVLQANIFGEVDPAISFSFVPLADDDNLQKATVQKMQADTAAVYIQSGVLDAAEERARLVADPESEYSTLDPDAVPEMPGAEMPPEEAGESDEEKPQENAGSGGLWKNFINALRGGNPHASA